MNKTTMKYLIITMMFSPIMALANTSDEIINAFPDMEQVKSVSEPHFYVNGHLISNGYDIASKMVRNLSSGATVGFQVNPFISYEMNIDLSNNEDFDYAGTSYELNQGAAYGLSIQFSTDVTKQYFGYAKFGFEATKLEINSTVSSADENERYFNVGIGGGYNITDSLYTTIGYRKGIANETDFDRDSFILSLGYRLNR